MSSTLDFYKNIKPCKEFIETLNPSASVIAPDDWSLIITDIQGSTKAVAEGKYQQVNYVGAASITSVLNELKEVEIPFVFGGDGATLLIPNQLRDRVLKSLSDLRAHVQEVYGLSIRIGCVPLSELSAKNIEIRISKYQLSAKNSIAIFMGGGVSAAEELIKAKGSSYLYETTLNLTSPNLEGLSCRWTPIKNKNGVTVSLIALARNKADAVNIYKKLISEFETILNGDIRSANPVYFDGLKAKVSYKGLYIEAKKNIFVYAFLILRQWLLKIILLLPHPQVQSGYLKYRRELVTHADYKKFDDVLRLVIDCTHTQVQQMQRMLLKYYHANEVFYGIHESSESLMTCLVFSMSDSDHLHFIDGAGGGYTMAAKMLKQQISQTKLLQSPT
jgi:hypothetical protein